MSDEKETDAIEIQDVLRGKVTPDGQFAELDVETASGSQKLRIAQEALRKLPLLTFQLLSKADKRSAEEPSRSYFSYPIQTARVGEHRDAAQLVLLVQFESGGAFLALEPPDVCLDLLKNDVEAIQRRRRLQPPSEGSH